MKNKPIRILPINWGISFIFGTSAFMFFAFWYPFHLNYQEQYQLFLFTPNYFLSFLKRPGGFSDYVGNFFTQFYFYKNIGAFILACLLTLFHRTIYSVSVKLGASKACLPLTLIPSIAYWGAFCNENFLLGGLIAMILVTSFTYFYLSLQNRSIRISLALCVLPLLYWLCGGVFIAFTLLVLRFEWKYQKFGNSGKMLFASVILLFSSVLPFLAKYIFIQYPTMRFWVGSNYFRFPSVFPVQLAVIAGLVILIPIFWGELEGRINLWKNRRLIFVQWAGIVLIGGWFIGHVADMEKEEIMAYDFNVRMRRWDRVIEMADKKAPSSPLSVTCLNLALAKQGLLGEKMFAYYQNGLQGLIPDFKRDFTIPLITGEVYYHLGLINTAQRYAFEAMEALPDYQKSVRCIKRLAETSSINGNYKLANKYLNLLTKTIYYRAWAKRAQQIIESDQAIERHREWGELRKLVVEKDFLFSENEKDMMLGLLFAANPGNKMAFEYLMATCLLNKDIQHFIEYFPLGKSQNYRVIPKSYQEALIYGWDITNKDKSKRIPYAIDRSVIKRMQGFKSLYAAKNIKLLEEKYADTFWYYYYFR